MSSDLTRSTSTAPGLSLKNRIGLGLAGLLGLGDTLSVFIVPWPGPGEADPPFAAFVADSVLGLITLVAVVYAWRSRSRVGGRIVAGSRILWTIIALPAFFIEGNPSTFIVLVAVLVVVTSSRLDSSCPAPEGPTRTPDDPGVVNQPTGGGSHE